MKIVNQPQPNSSLKARYPIWLLLLVVIACNFAIRWRLRDMPLERDEGEYAYAGQLILQGIPPYELAWNMKFPGTYLAYAILMAVFGQSPGGIHTGLILVTSLSALFVFLIGRKLMGELGGLMSAALFTFLTAAPLACGLAGHATHFVVLFVCAGTFALLKGEENKSAWWILAGGVAMGAAITMKQHALVFALGAGIWLACWRCGQSGKLLRYSSAYAAGVAFPLVVMAGTLALCGVWQRFIFWTIQYARQYVSILPLRAAPGQFVQGFGPVLASGIWIWFLGLLALGLVFLRAARRQAAVVGAGLLLAGLVATAPGFYFRNHYFLMAMPGLALLNTALLLALADWLKRIPQARWLRFIPACLFCAVAGDLVIRNADIWVESPPFEACRKLYGYNPFPEAGEIARYIRTHSAPEDTVGVLGSEPEICFLSHRHSASGYIYVYPLTEIQPLAGIMRPEFMREIEAAKPKCVVYVNILPSWRTIIVPGETQKVLDQFNQWWDGYSTNYQLVGMVDMAEGKPSEFYWDEELSSRTNDKPADISVFRRK